LPPRRHPRFSGAPGAHRDGGSSRVNSSP
jgi:hypothetical protein